jgi:hypothetical protein
MAAPADRNQQGNQRRGLCTQVVIVDEGLPCVECRGNILLPDSLGVGQQQGIPLDRAASPGAQKPVELGAGCGVRLCTGKAQLQQRERGGDLHFAGAILFGPAEEEAGPIGIRQDQ